jgi:putative NADH-flavin reductase
VKVMILGASGGVGRLAVQVALAAGHEVTAQTRAAARLAELDPAVRVAEADPASLAALLPWLDGQDAVLYALGHRQFGPTTVFSDTTRALIEGMARCGVGRLVAITGVGAGETRGHGGWFYDRVIFPLFTARMYADKNRQEALIAASGLDWTILRPAPFAARVPPGPPEIHETVPPDLRLTRVTRAEVAEVAVGLLADPRSHHKRLFVGHR